MRHTSHWFETDERAEWPLSENAQEEEPPQDDEPFDFQSKPERFYMEVETDGSLAPREVVMKGLNELQTKLGSLLLGLKAPVDLEDATYPEQHPQTNGFAPQPTQTGWGSSPAHNGATSWGAGGGGWGANPSSTSGWASPNPTTNQGWNV